MLTPKRHDLAKSVKVKVCALTWYSVIDAGTIKIHLAVDKDIIGHWSELGGCTSVGVLCACSHIVFYNFEIFP